MANLEYETSKSTFMNLIEHFLLLNIESVINLIQNFQYIYNTNYKDSDEICPTFGTPIFHKST